jgi:hypothetical protein
MEGVSIHLPFDISQLGKVKSDKKNDGSIPSFTACAINPQFSYLSVTSFAVELAIGFDPGHVSALAGVRRVQNPGESDHLPAGHMSDTTVHAASAKREVAWRATAHLRVAHPTLTIASISATASPCPRDRRHFLKHAQSRASSPGRSKSTRPTCEQKIPCPTNCEYQRNTQNLSFKITPGASKFGRLKCASVMRDSHASW